MANGNSENNTSFNWQTILKDFGMPTFMVLVMGWVMITYWIGPQTELIKTLTDSNKKLGETFSALTESIQANRSTLEDLADNTKEQNEVLTDYSKSIADAMKQASQEHKDILNKIQ